MFRNILTTFLLFSPFFYFLTPQALETSNPVARISSIKSIPNESSLLALYNSLDPKSISQHLAFYELYSPSQLGKKALSDAWRLLSRQNNFQSDTPISFSLTDNNLHELIHLVNRPSEDRALLLNEDVLYAIERISNSLSNRKLKGFLVDTEEEVQALDPSEVDIARALLISQLRSESSHSLKRRSYEALIDLMSLQIRARLQDNASPEEKIYEINHFIFDEMWFRFPPHSIYAKDVDLYTFLPSVLDSRRGVCLGVSILYLCLAQRLDLPLEVITPPGHIYIRYHSPSGKFINIETTLRGVHLDNELYLGINTCSLQKRDYKEVIGMAHFNEASVYWKQQNYEKAVSCYEQARKYLPNDKLLLELLGYNYLFTGRIKEGEKLLKEVEGHIPDHAIAKDTMIEDYFNGKVDIEGMKSVFMFVDDSLTSIQKKRTSIESTLERFPEFRDGYFNLAITWLQLQRPAEALRALEKYHSLHAFDPTAEYYLAVLYSERLDLNKAWYHLKQTEAIVQSKLYSPRALKELRASLTFKSPN